MTRQKRNEPSVGFPSASMPGRSEKIKYLRTPLLKPLLYIKNRDKMDESTACPPITRHNKILLRFPTSCCPDLTHFHRRELPEKFQCGKERLSGEMAAQDVGGPGSRFIDIAYKVSDRYRISLLLLSLTMLTSNLHHLLAESSDLPLCPVSLV